MCLFAGVWFVFGTETGKLKLQIVELLVQQKIETIRESVPTPESNAKTTSSSGRVVLNVPFAPQAPFGGWGDERQQDGCEETSAIMAMAWVKKEKLTLQGTLDKIFAISAYEQKNYGNFRDTSAGDTVKRIFNGYFGYTKVAVRYGITTDDIKKEILNGNLVIVPVNGQKLGNPFFSQPGPMRHMLVVKGYDSSQNKFITNDPGTKHGESYAYSASILQGSLRDYVTGSQLLIVNVQRAMIVVSP